MILKTLEITKRNNLHVFLKRQNEKFLKDRNIKVCYSCNGKGLSSIHNLNVDKETTIEIYSWDCVSFCDYCNGIGFIGVDLGSGLEITETTYLCRSCDNGGCESCEFKGTVDWISHSMGK